MPDQLYVFKTISRNGTCILGTHGLSYHDMEKLKTYYVSVVNHIVPAPEETGRLNIVTPLSSNLKF